MKRKKKEFFTEEIIPYIKGKGLVFSPVGFYTTKKLNKQIKKFKIKI